MSSSTASTSPTAEVHAQKYLCPDRRNVKKKVISGISLPPCSVWKRSHGHCNVRATLWASHGADPGAEVCGVHQRARPGRGGHFPSPGSGQCRQAVQRRLRCRREALLPQVVHRYTIFFYSNPFTRMPFWSDSTQQRASGGTLQGYSESRMTTENQNDPGNHCKPVLNLADTCMSLKRSFLYKEKKKTQSINSFISFFFNIYSEEARRDERDAERLNNFCLLRAGGDTTSCSVRRKPVLLNATSSSDRALLITLFI